MKILIFNNGIVCKYGMSGSDRRAIHCAKVFSKKHSVSVVTPAFAKERFQGIDNLYCTVKVEGSAILFHYFWRAFLGILIAFRIRKRAFDVVYSTSDLLPDTIPSFFLKCISSKTRWICGLHLIAPSPLRGYKHAYDKEFVLPDLKLLYYFITQSIIIFLIRKSAFLVFVSNDQDKERLLKKGFSENHVLVTYGAPEWDLIQCIEKKPPQFDICFIGRFHPQKGYDDLLKAWAIVQNLKAGLRLAIIGDIPEDVLQKKLKLYQVSADSIKFYGFVDALEKYTVLSQSKVLAFPSWYESFGMVAVEAQASGVPVVAYDLPIYRVLFPQGTIRVKIRDVRAFAKALIYLLTHENERCSLAEKASENARRFDFQKNAENILNLLGG